MEEKKLSVLKKVIHYFFLKKNENFEK